MALWPMHSFDRDMDPMRDFDRFERRMMRDMDRFQRRMMPYWRDDDQSILHFANQAHEEEKTEHGHMERSYVRSWTLPDEVDLDAVHTQLTDVGHLCIEAPKTGLHRNRKTLPIQAAPKTK
ncbi:hypothetical protein NECAME_17786 [Necator americanus]|uniref:SHSP domain-containing protein n=1 Tax=Necator americanus TaxID=51031 RepID=W2TM62_NECAM|nr:hypothetical protein NECAME_17786 [Necator americanus]ETN82122.1 hypothetical protein NECAME_17786 [Necator americanus]